MMNFDKLYLEATRRGFLKQLGGALMGTAVPGGGKIAQAASAMTKPAAAAASAVTKFKVLHAATCRGEFEIGSVYDVAADSAKQAMSMVIDTYKENEREEWENDDPEYKKHGFFPSEFIDAGDADEERGLGGGSVGEEDSVYVIRDDNPLYKLLDGVDEGWRDLGEKAYDLLQNGLDKWNLGNWDKYIEQYKDDIAEAEAEQEDYTTDEAKADRRAAQEKEWDKARKEGEEMQREYERANRVIQITLPRHVAQALLDILIDALFLDETFE